MNQESEIIQLRLLDAESKVVEWGEQQAKALQAAYRKQVRKLAGSIEIANEEDIERIVSELALVNTPVVAETFAAAGVSILATTEAALSWDGRYTGYKSVAMSQNQLKGLALTEKINGKNLTAHLDTAIGSEVRSMISDARIRGVGINKMTSEIFNALGGQVSRRNIETVSRTYTATASSYAKRLTYEQNSDVIKGYLWCATLENGGWKTGRGTCPRCAALDQREYKSLADVPPFPLHPNCRCFPTPVTKSWEEIIEKKGVLEMEKAYRPWTERLDNRRKEDYGTTDQSYGDWWLTKSKEWQDSSTVGPTRARMIRAGDIKYEDIVDPATGNLYTIKQLLSKHNIGE